MASNRGSQSAPSAGLGKETTEESGTTVPSTLFAADSSLRTTSTEPVDPLSTLSDQLHKFAAWAQSECGAATLGEALVLAMQYPPPIQEWQTLQKTDLAELATAPEHPYCILDRWADQLPDRSRFLFQARIAGAMPEHTLEDLGSLFSITRERARQLILKVQRELNQFLTQSDADPLHWRAATIRRKIGVAIPTQMAEPLLIAPRHTNDYRWILLNLAGPYVLEDEWLILESAQKDDPTRAIMEQADEVGRIDQESAERRLVAWGLREDLYVRWLTRKGSIRSFNGQLVKWGTSIPDRMAFALADLNRPATIDELAHHTGEQTTRNSIANALANDPKIVRVDRKNWGLASWNQPIYTTIPQSMGDFLKEHDIPMSINRVAHAMADKFNIREATTRAYLAAPMFIVEHGQVRLRNHRSEPFQTNPDSVRETPGVFHLGPRRVAKVVTITDDSHRGSGTSLTYAVAAILELKVNEEVTFSTSHNETIKVTFPETSLMGPLIGSIRAIIQRLSGESGDILTLILDRERQSVEARLTAVSTIQSSWDTVSRLTGISHPVDLNNLATSLHCTKEEVQAVLRSRGDDLVIKALPKREVTPKLKDALEDLTAQILQG